MKVENRLQIAENSLDRTLEFFSRVDSKASFIFAFDTGMLVLIALNFDFSEALNWHIALPGGVATIMLLGSLYFIYRSQFPQLKGGTDSKIYFKEIAARNEEKFIDVFMHESEENLLKDVLGQVWRNSEILRQKYSAVKMAFILTGVAIIPWLAFFVATATYLRAIIRQTT